MGKVLPCSLDVAGYICFLKLLEDPDPPGVIIKQAHEAHPDTADLLHHIWIEEQRAVLLVIQVGTYNVELPLLGLIQQKAWMGLLVK